MNGVLGFMRLLQGEAITEKQENYVRLALASGESLLSIINDILDFSKIEAGKLTLAAVDFNLNDLTDEVTDFFSEQAQKRARTPLPGLSRCRYLSQGRRSQAAPDHDKPYRECHQVYGAGRGCSEGEHR